MNLKKRTWKKINNPETSRIYREELIAMAEDDGAYPCAKCGHVVRPGYCCDTCDTDNPNKEE